MSTKCSAAKWEPTAFTYHYPTLEAAFRSCFIPRHKKAPAFAEAFTQSTASDLKLSSNGNFDAQVVGDQVVFCEIHNAR